jgi:hypothetical protein
VQVDPLKPMMKAPRTKHLKPYYDEPPSNFAFKFNMRRYNAAAAMSDGAALNRLAKFASSEALLVVRGGAEAQAGPGPAHSPPAHLKP